MASKSQVTLTFTGNDKQLSNTFDHVEKKSRKLNKAFGVMATGAVAGGAALVTATVAAGTALFKLGQNFDAAHDNIVAGTGASGKALEGLKDSFDNVLTSVPTTFGDASTAIADINTALGLTGKPLEDLSAQFINLSRVSKEDLGGSIQSVTRMFGDWDIAVDKQAVTMDKLWTVSQATGIGVGQLSDKMVKMGAPLRQLGFSMEESAALFGKWNKEGVNTDIIFSGVRQSISKFARAGEDIPQAFAGATKAIKEAGSASEATAMAIEIFGAEAGPDMAAAIREGRFEIEELVAQMNDAEGAISRTAKDTESFGEKWQLFKNQMAVAFKPAAIAIFDAVGRAIEWLSPLITNHIVPAMQQAGRVVSEMATKFKNAFKTGFSEDEGSRIETLAFKIRDFKDFIVQDFIPAVQRAMDKFREIWEKIGPDVTRIFNQLVAVIKAAIELIRTVIKTNVEGIMLVWDMFGKEITTVATIAFDLIVGVISGAMTVIQGIIKTVTALMKGDWSAAWDGMKQILSGAITVIKAIARAGWESMKATAGVAWRGIKALMGGILQAIRSVVVSVITAIVSLWTTKWNQARAITSSVLNAIKSLISRIMNGARSTVSSQLDSIVSFFRRLPGRIASALSGLASSVTKPFRDAYNGATEWLNKIPGVGSVSKVFSGVTNLPFFHGGGEFRAPVSGGEGLAVLRDKEQVFTPEQVHALGAGMGSGEPQGSGQVVIRIDSGGTQIDRFLVELLRKSIVNQGGDVQAVLGV